MMAVPSQDGRSLRSRIQAASLTDAEQRIASVVLDDYPQSALLNGRLIAAAAGVSPASVSRFASKLGYRNFSQVQDSLRAEMRARLSTPPKRLALDRGSRRRTANTLLTQAVERDIENLRATLELVDGRELERLVHRMSSPRGKVYIAGSKKGNVVARYLFLQLRQLRAGVELIELSESVADQVLDLSERDLLISIEPRRATRSLVRLVELVRRSGAAVAFLGDSDPPPVLARSEYVFTAVVSGLTFFDSYAGLFALCNALLAAIIQERTQPIAKRTAKLEALNRSLGAWHDAGAPRVTGSANERAEGPHGGSASTSNGDPTPR